MANWHWQLATSKEANIDYTTKTVELCRVGYLRRTTLPVSTDPGWVRYICVSGWKSQCLMNCGFMPGVTDKLQDVYASYKV